MSSPLSMLKMDSQQIKKVFPSLYYSKYAQHLKILDFENALFEQESRNPHVNLQKHKDQTKQKLYSSVNVKQVPRVNISKFDNFKDTIFKNKLELKRMNKYNSVLTLKMKSSPQKKNVMRTLIKNNKPIDEKVLLRMKAIEDAQYQKNHQIRANSRLTIQKESQCKFVKRSKSANCSPAKLNSSRLNPQVKKSVFIPQFLPNQTRRTKAQSINIRILEKNSSCSSSLFNMNSATRKSPSSSIKRSESSYKGLKIMRRKNFPKTVQKCERKDLVKQTEMIRNSVMSMHVLKRYEAVQQWKKKKANLLAL